MKIGNIELPQGACLAPMAGVADRAFRELCIDYGAKYVVGEMVSSKGVSMNDKKSKELMYLSEKEHPSAIQIFGDTPEIMAIAARSALEFKPDVIDINMGCPAPKIAGNGGGSALMKNPQLAQDITKAVVNAVDLPVTVKIRAGWDGDSLNAVEMAKRCESVGASAITVHGRTKQQMYAPPVNTDIIRDVKKAVSIPVIANGDITDGVTAAIMFEKTGCDMVMVGRGALGRPWVFSQIDAYLNHTSVLPEPPLSERMMVMLKHIKKICEYKGDYIGMREARKHAAWYIKGIRGAAAYRQKVGALSSLEQLEELIVEVMKANGV
ncbi:MAG: tRNA dihydrouridine synthase DusB [Clostridiales bacterium]|nr:tRNA dihydrouridine synthase DusB [Clostridiales bacterium]